MAALTGSNRVLAGGDSATSRPNVPRQLGVKGATPLPPELSCRNRGLERMSATRVPA